MSFCLVPEQIAALQDLCLYRAGSRLTPLQAMRETVKLVRLDGLAQSLNTLLDSIENLIGADPESRAAKNCSAEISAEAAKARLMLNSLQETCDDQNIGFDLETARTWILDPIEEILALNPIDALRNVYVGEGLGVQIAVDVLDTMTQGPNKIPNPSFQLLFRNLIRFFVRNRSSESMELFSKLSPSLKHAIPFSDGSKAQLEMKLEQIKQVLGPNLSIISLGQVEDLLDLLEEITDWFPHVQN